MILYMILYLFPTLTRANKSECMHALYYRLCTFTRFMYVLYGILHDAPPNTISGWWIRVSECIYILCYILNTLTRANKSECMYELYYRLCTLTKHSLKICIYYMVYYTMHHQIPFQGGEYEWLSVYIYYTVYHIHSLHTCIHDTTHSTS